MMVSYRGFDSQMARLKLPMRRLASAPGNETRQYRNIPICTIENGEHVVVRIRGQVKVEGYNST